MHFDSLWIKFEVSASQLEALGTAQEAGAGGRLEAVDILVRGSMIPTAPDLPPDLAS